MSPIARSQAQFQRPAAMHFTLQNTNTAAFSYKLSSFLLPHAVTYFSNSAKAYVFCVFFKAKLFMPH